MHVEKLSEKLTVSLPDSTARQLRGIAEAGGVTPSELVRELIEQRVQAEKDKFHALANIFGTAA